MLEWSLDALRRVPAIEQSSSRCRRAYEAPPGTRGVAGGAGALGTPCAPRCAAASTATLSSSTTPPGRSLTPSSSERAARAGAPSGADAAIAAAPRDRHDQASADGDGSSRARWTARALWAIQTPQVFRRDVAASARSTRTTRRARRRHRRRSLVEARGRDGARGRGARARTSRSRPRATCASPSACAPSEPPASMLTDYHVHLRPDEPGTTAERVLHRRQRRALPRGGRRARDRRARRRRAHLPLHARRSTSGSTRCGARAPTTTSTRYCEFVRERDRPAARHRGRLHPRPRGAACATLLEARDWDYVVGSIHFLRDGALDYARLRRLEPRARRPTTVWRRYFEPARRGGRAAGMFDILAHPDLVKHWGERAPAARAATCASTTTWRWRGSPSRASPIEVSTAGLRKPVGEIYPDRAFLEMVPRRGLPGRPVQRRPRRPTSSATATTRRSSCSSGLGVDRDRRLRAPRAAPGADRDERRAPGIGYDSHRFDAGRAGSSSAGWRSSTSAGSPATPTPTC